MATLNPKFQKRRPLDDIPGLKLDALLEGRRSLIKVEALGHTLVLDELSRENDIDREAEKWNVYFDEKCIAKMYLHPDHGWPKIVLPEGRGKITEVRAWVWDMARAHKVNAENILESRDGQFPDACVTRLAHNNFQDPDERPGFYFRYALRHAWEL